MIPLELIREFEKQMKALKIGGTSLVRAQKLERKLGIRRLYLKLEGENPSGTHKDRIALLYALDARMKGMDTLVAASCGNFGAALAHTAEKLNIKARVYIPKDFAAPRKAEIESTGGKIVLVDGDYEASIRKAAEESAKNGWYSANPGGANKEIGMYGYTYIAKEVGQSLGRPPDWVSVPVGNGELISGMWQGFRSMGMKPRLLGYSNNNAIVYGLSKGAKAKLDVPALEVTEINEPLCGNFVTDPDEALAAVIDSNGIGVEMPDSELVKAAKLIMDEEGLDVLPASAGAVTAITKLDSRNHVFVAVLTGRGHFT